MKLWGGRFTKETNQLVHNFNASIGFDQKFFRQDIEGSIAHVTMLAKQGILTAEERDCIVEGLKGICKDIENGTLVIDDTYEDIHSFVEAHLISRIGDTGKKLHTGRSRNDQVALDMKLYTRDEVLAVDELLKTLLQELLKIMNEKIKKTKIQGKLSTTAYEEAPQFILKLVKYPSTFLNSHNCAKS